MVPPYAVNHITSAVFMDSDLWFTSNSVAAHLLACSLVDLQSTGLASVTMLGAILGKCKLVKA